MHCHLSYVARRLPVQLPLALLALATLTAQSVEGRSLAKASSPPTPYKAVEGVVNSQVSDNGMTYWMTVKGLKRTRQLLFPDIDPGPIVSGSSVRIFVDAAEVGMGMVDQPFRVRHLQLVALPQTVTDMFPIGGKRTKMTSAVILVRMCGMAPSISLPAFKAQWLNSASASSRSGSSITSPSPATMQDYIQSCSYNKVSFSDADNVVLGPIDLPCNGTSPAGTVYSTSTCTPDDVYGWAEAAEAAVQNVLKQDLKAYRHRILIIPPLPACRWNGLAQVGCGDSCYTWIRGNSASNLSTIFHELSHNFGLEHASVPGSAEYGDISDPMGSCCALRCHNAPHAWQMGWAKPQAELDGSTLPVGLWRDFTLPAQALADTAMLRVTPTWLASAGPGTSNASLHTAVASLGASSTMPAYFISFRTAHGFDSGLDASMRGRVHVHIFNGSQYTASGLRTELQGTYAAGSTWSSSSVNISLQDNTGRTPRLTMRVRSMTAVTAAVSLCRADVAIESGLDACHDGLDNDCDGVIDEDDPSCTPPTPSQPTTIAPAPSNSNTSSGGAGSTLAPGQPDPDMAQLPGGRGCNRNGICERARGETSSTCPADCPSQCGDAFCDARRNETARSCPGDCAPRCGDGFCDPRGESAASCALDCPRAICGNGICEIGENQLSCARDCCAKPRCGDGFCDAFAGETCKTCAKDCKGKSKGKGSFCCGSSRTGCSDPRCNKRGSFRCRPDTCAA